MDDEAPSFPSGVPGWESKRYPLGGAKTGAAWRAMWAALGQRSDGEWLGRDALSRLGAAAAGCDQGTAKVLLSRAAGAAVLEREYRTIGGRRRVFYRRASGAYRMVVAALADGKYRAVVLGGAEGERYLQELVDRGALERRWDGRAQYRLTWTPPAGVK